MQAAATDSVMSLEEAVWVDVGRVGGAPCFRGTRVPVQVLWDHVHGDSTLTEFLGGFPTVSPEQAWAVLHHAEEALAARL